MGREIATSRGYRVAPLAPHLNWGAQVFDFDPASLADPEIRKDLRALWVQEGVIAFRKLQGSETQIALSEIFGPLLVHPRSDNIGKDHKELIDVHHTPEDAWIIKVDGDPRNGYLHWHTDLVYTDQINHGGILRPVKLPSRLGQTGFMDKISAYTTLPDDLKARIANLHVVYRYDFAKWPVGRQHDFEVVQYSSYLNRIFERTARGDYPDVIHPMVYAQPETGRMVLNVSPWFAAGIYEMPGADGDALLEEVAQHISNEANAYYHQWQQDDMVLWDNWRVLHSAQGAPPEEERHLRRTTIGGDYSLGRLHPAFTEPQDERQEKRTYIQV